MKLFNRKAKTTKEVPPVESKDVQPVKPDAIEPAAPKRPEEAVGVFENFDRVFDDWFTLVPLRGADVFGRGWVPAELIRVDQVRQDGALVVRAELPGIDPDKDLELTVSDGILCIDAERHEEAQTEKDGYLRRELRYGAFRRSLPLPVGVTASDITASYKDGILEVRIPTPEPTPLKRVPIART
jgi:HSP20 family protein